MTSNSQDMIHDIRAELKKLIDFVSLLASGGVILSIQRYPAISGIESVCAQPRILSQLRKSSVGAIGDVPHAYRRCRRRGCHQWQKHKVRRRERERGV